MQFCLAHNFICNRGPSFITLVEANTLSYQIHYFSVTTLVVYPVASRSS